eukprot:359881-Ditylum_brightwellii.AAC.1
MTRQRQRLAPSILSKHLTINLLRVNEGDKTSEEGFNRDGNRHYGNKHDGDGNGHHGDGDGHDCSHLTP